MNPVIQRDERTAFVENASTRWGFLLLSYGVLLDVMYRGWRGEAAWDLMAIVVAAGGVATIYQARQQVLSTDYVRRLAWLSVVSAVVAAVIVWLRSLR